MYHDGQRVLLRWQGKITGPFLFSQVRMMLYAGQITQRHELSVDGGDWQPLSLVSARPQPSIRPVQPINVSSRPDPDLDSAIPPMPRSAQNRWSKARLSPRMMLLIAVATSPLLLVNLIGTVEQAAWFLMGYFAFLWGYLFYLMLMPDSRLRNTGLLYAAFTCFIGIPILLFWQRLPALQVVRSILDAGDVSADRVIIAWIMGVGFVEEVCKAMPLLVFALTPRVMRSVRDGVWFGAMSGLGFALAEGVSYSYTYWNTQAILQMRYLRDAMGEVQDWLGRVPVEQIEAQIETVMPELLGISAFMMAVQIVRWISLSMLHAAWAGIVGFCVAYAFLYSRWIIFLAGLAVASVLHGVYNFFSNDLLGVIIAAISVALFLMLLRQAQWAYHLAQTADHANMRGKQVQ
jgi:RsiW-degrading membrane proteinase PrsW (M82 family)